MENVTSKLFYCSSPFPSSICHQLPCLMWYQSLVLPHLSLLWYLHHQTLPVSLLNSSLLFCTPPPPLLSSTLLLADIVEALNHQLDAKWRHFGTFLRVDYQVMEAIRLDNSNRPDDCMLDLLSKWTSNQAGTGTLPRTWQAIVDAVKKTGFRVIAENLALEHGVTLSHWQCVTYGELCRWWHCHF